jgi:hypothetical protein
MSGRSCENLSTDAMYRGGVIRSSDEGAVMVPEQRDGIVQLHFLVNRENGRN